MVLKDYDRQMSIGLFIDFQPLAFVTCINDLFEVMTATPIPVRNGEVYKWSIWTCKGFKLVVIGFVSFVNSGLDCGNFISWISGYDSAIALIFSKCMFELELWN